MKDLVDLQKEDILKVQNNYKVSVIYNVLDVFR